MCIYIYSCQVLHNIIIFEPMTLAGAVKTWPSETEAKGLAAFESSQLGREWLQLPLALLCTIHLTKGPLLHFNVQQAPENMPARNSLT